MKTKKTITALLITLLFLSWNGGSEATAQVNRQVANHWYFGNNYGLNFSDGTPQVDNSSSIFTYEAATTMSDKEGNLLFYTNGGGSLDNNVTGYIWNGNHEVMEGGDLGNLIGGGYSAAQGALSFQKPGLEGQYYLFTIDEAETISSENNPFPEGKGLSYFEIDMTANGGLGAVTVSNEKLLSPAFEHMAAVKHGNCEDYWLLTTTGHRYFTNDPETLDSFYLFRITPNGIDEAIVTPIPDNVDCVLWREGMIRFSPDGSRFLCAGYLFDFDENTGEIGDYIDLELAAEINPLFPMAFSPNGRFLYYFMVFNEGQQNSSLLSFKVIQYDLEAASLFWGTEFLHSVEAPGPTINGRAQLGPDGKIYLPYHYGDLNVPTRIYVVNNPNVKGAGSDFQGPITMLSQPSNQPFLNFGNYPADFFYYDSTATLPLELEDEYILDCEDANSFIIENSNPYDCQLWSTGDTSSIIEVNSPGIYWLEVAEGCDVGRDTFEVIFENNIFTTELGNDTTLCEDEEILLVPEVVLDATYTWQDGSSAPFIYANQAGVYWVEIQLDECIDSDTIVINVLPDPVVDIGEDTILCTNESLFLNVTDPFSWTYEWEDGSWDPFFTISQPGFYSVTVSNDCGVAEDEIFVNYEICLDSVPMTIDSIDCDLFFPNVFTPGESENNYFSAITECDDFSRFNLKVFNRWGNVVFSGRTVSETWNGSRNDQPSPADVYFYRLEYGVVNELGQELVGIKFGDVTLLR